MRGSIRRRGQHSYEYIVDIGSAAAQRCQACGRRFWLERKTKESCPRCGGELAETEERRRAIKGGFATRRECEAALAKVLAALEAQTFTPPTKITVKHFLLSEWLPTVKGSLRPTTYASYEMLAKEHIIPRLGALQMQKLSPAAINALYAHLVRARPRPRRRSALGLLGAPCPRCAAQGWPRRRALGTLDGEPGDWCRSTQGNAEHSDRLPVWTTEQLSAFLTHVADDRLYALWRLLAMTGMRRGEALGLGWEDLDMESGAVTIRRTWIPVDGVAQFSEPKSRNSRRTMALDPVTLEAMKAHAARQAEEQSGWQEGLAAAGLVFTRSDGRPLVPWAVSKAFRDHSASGAAAAHPAAWPAPHLRHPGLGQWCQPAHCLGQARSRHRGPHLGRLLARPAAGRPRGRREDRGVAAGQRIGPSSGPLQTTGKADSVLAMSTEQGSFSRSLAAGCAGPSGLVLRPLLAGRGCSRVARGLPSRAAILGPVGRQNRTVFAPRRVTCASKRAVILQQIAPSGPLPRGKSPARRAL